MNVFSATCLLALVATGRAQLDDCIEVYQHTEFSGASTEICTPNTPLLPANVTNVISSVRVGTNVGLVTYFDETDFDGDFLKRSGDIDRTGPLGFNDNILSIHYNWLALPDSAILGQGCIFVFQHGVYEGKVTELCRNTSALGEYGFSDQISSVQLGPGVERVRLFENVGYWGRALDVYPPGIARLGPVGFNDITTSIRIFP